MENRFRSPDTGNFSAAPKLARFGPRENLSLEMTHSDAELSNWRFHKRFVTQDRSEGQSGLFVRLIGRQG